MSFEFIFTGFEGEFGFHKSEVIRESRACDLLAIGAVAENRTAVVASHGVLNGIAEAGSVDCGWC